MRKLYLLVCVCYLLHSCVRSESPNIYEENIGDANEKLTYCDTCLTKIDVFRFEQKRNSFQLQQVLTTRQAAEILGTTLHTQGNSNPWSNTLMFLERRKGFNIIHAYSADIYDRISTYTAAIFISNKTIDSIVGISDSRPSAFTSIKSIYKNKKLELDKRLGRVDEKQKRLSEDIAADVRKELRFAMWSRKMPNPESSSDVESYVLSIDYFDNCGSIELTSQQKNDCYKSLTKEKLVVRFTDNFFEIPRLKGHRLEDLSLDQIKKRSTYTGFQTYLNELRFERRKYDDYMSEENQRTVRKDSLFRAGAEFRHYNEMIEKGWDKLKPQDFDIPKGYEKTNSEILWDTTLP